MALEQLRLQQEMNLEKIFMAKKELEQLNQLQEARIAKKKAIYLQRDALDEEMRLKDKNSKEFLDRVLQKGTKLEQKLLQDGALTDAEAADLLKALVDEKLGGEFSKQNLMDKLYEAKQREIKKVETITKDKIKNLNAEKKKLVDMEMKILEEKGKHQLLRQRGLDFLVELEMGQGPDIEDIKRNLEVDPKTYSRTSVT
jgi:HD superfamily phosphohydrolase